MMKNIMFNLFGYVGFIFLIVILIFLIIELLNKLLKSGKYIIMYYEFKKNEELYDIRNNVVVHKNGSVRYSCVGTLEEKIEILNKAIKQLESLKELKDEFKSSKQ